MASSDTWRALARTLVGDPEFTSAEVAAQAGVDIEQARRLWRALGFPPVSEDARIFTHSDVAVLQAVGALRTQTSIEPEIILQLTRVTGQSLARIAEAHLAAASDRPDVIGAASAPSTVDICPVRDVRQGLPLEQLRHRVAGFAAAATGFNRRETSSATSLLFARHRILDHGARQIATCRERAGPGEL